MISQFCQIVNDWNVDRLFQDGKKMPCGHYVTKERLNLVIKRWDSVYVYQADRFFGTRLPKNI